MGKGVGYEVLYKWLKDLAKSYGLTVEERQSVLDYGAMNPEAAQAMNFPSKSMVIYVDPDSEPKRKCYDLGHELVEFCWMRGGMQYWPAHKKALKAEEKGPAMFSYVEKVMRESATEGLLKSRSEELAQTPRPTYPVKVKRRVSQSVSRMK